MEAMHEVYGPSSDRQSEGGNMNRQARLEGSKEWTDYGKVSFFVAIKTEAIKASRRNSLPESVWIIECRCESDPDVIDTFSVQTRIDAEVLNPRRGDL
jgi:hypothetical protein